MAHLPKLVWVTPKLRPVWIAVRFDFDNDFNKTIGPFVNLEDAIDACDNHYSDEYGIDDGLLDTLNWRTDDDIAIANIDMCCNGGYYEVRKFVIQ